MIQAIGLHWKAEDVFWGRRKKPGRLLGIPENQKRAKPIDFRDEIAIYVLYADFRPIYAGQVGAGTQRLFDRLKRHLDGDLRGRWNRFSWYGLRRVLKSGRLSNINKQFHPRIDDVLNNVEGILIDAMEPGQNRQSGRFAKVVFYRQHRDKDNLGPSVDDMLRHIYKQSSDVPKKTRARSGTNEDAARRLTRR